MRGNSSQLSRRKVPIIPVISDQLQFIQTLQTVLQHLTNMNFNHQLFINLIHHPTPILKWISSDPNTEKSVVYPIKSFFLTRYIS